MSRKWQKPKGLENDDRGDNAHRDDGKRNINGLIEVRGEVETRFPPAFVEEYQASNKKSGAIDERSEERDKKRFRVEIITLAVLVIYAALTAVQSCKAAEQVSQATRSNDNAIRFFRADERAWVEFSEVKKTDVSLPEPAQKQFKYEFFLKNVGKTVARDVTVSLENFRSDRSLSDDSRFLEDEQDKISGHPKEPFRFAPNTLSPGVQAIVPIPAFTDEPYPRQTTTDDYNPSTQYYFILGRIDYKDNFGAAHWMRFCFATANLVGDLDYCHHGNNEDSNPEPEP